MSSDEESDVEMADESIKKGEEDEEDREDLIASPEPEPLNSSREDSVIMKNEDQKWIGRERTRRTRQRRPTQGRTALSPLFSQFNV
jgi:hypothetical protein